LINTNANSLPIAEVNEEFCIYPVITVDWVIRGEPEKSSK
jgi:hypothetical protein